MPKQVLVLWRDIPSQVILQKGRKREKAMLSERFQEAIDRAAMRAGKGSSDLYLAEWKRETSQFNSDTDLQTLAAEKAAEIEAEWSDERLLNAIRAHGLEEMG